MIELIAETRRKGDDTSDERAIPTPSVLPRHKRQESLKSRVLELTALQETNERSGVRSEVIVVNSIADSKH